MSLKNWLDIFYLKHFMQIYLSFIIGVLTALICAHYAQKRGRSQQAWFAIGLLFGLFGILVLFLLPGLESVEDVSRESSNKNSKKEAESSQEMSDPRFQTWFCLDEKQQQIGPLSFLQLVRAWKDCVVTPKSYVWTEGMPEWQLLGQLPHLLEKLR